MMQNYGQITNSDMVGTSPNGFLMKLMVQTNAGVYHQFWRLFTEATLGPWRSLRCSREYRKALIC